MKKKGLRSAIIAYAVAVVLIVAPVVVMTVWGDNAGIQGAKASLYIAIFAGVLVAVFSTSYIIRYAIFRVTLAKGRKVSARYVTSEMKSSNSTKDFYSVTYSYEDGDKTVTATTGIVYSWDQALAFKYAQEFEVTVYKSHSYVTADADALVEQHKPDIDAFKRAYAEAYNKYHSGV